MFELDDEAMELYTAWWTSKGQDKSSETRVDGIVKKVAIVLARTNDMEKYQRRTDAAGVDFGDFVIACRDKYNPLDASTWIQVFENLIISVHQIHGSMTSNQCRKAVPPRTAAWGYRTVSSGIQNLDIQRYSRENRRHAESEIFRLKL